ncbi:MAG: hypothetical protein LBO71_02985 [Prevotellaceae bacterium]|jgi:hypothetical protein|nr:hypothetical protein [Prevotellaceae bacterium]
MNAKKIKDLEMELQRSISEERAQQERKRFDTIKKLYDVFMEDDPCSNSSAYLNDALLLIVVGSYFDDIYKYKLYSHSERADDHKQGAYIIKWISKIRPIQLLPNKEITKELLFINSSFAIFVGFSFLNLNVFDAIDPHFYKHLLYEMQYRNISGKNYACLLYAIEKMASRGKKMNS